MTGIDTPAVPASRYRCAAIADAFVDVAIAGNDRSANVLVHTLMPLIRARVRRAFARAGTQLGSADVDDVVQQIWLELFVDRARRLRAYDPERGATLTGYVAILADREIASLVRKTTARKRGGGTTVVSLADDLPSASAGPEELAVAADFAVRLIEHLDRCLPTSGRIVLDRVFVGDRSATEVAATAGVSLQVVYNWQHRIRIAARAFTASASEKVRR